MLEVDVQSDGYASGHRVSVALAVGAGLRCEVGVARRDHFGVVVFGVLLQRRPEEQVFARDVDAQFLDVGLAGDLLGNKIYNCAII